MNICLEWMVAPADARISERYLQSRARRSPIRCTVGKYSRQLQEFYGECDSGLPNKLVANHAARMSESAQEARLEQRRGPALLQYCAILGTAQRVRGRVNVNLAPFEDSAQIRPPCASTIPLAI
jgi:hypothetical protein